LLSSQKEDENFKKVLGELAKNTIRFGGGTRKGFGEINIESLNCESFDLTDSNDLERYINKTSSLNDPIWNHDNLENHDKIKVTDENWTEYELKLTPDDFFLFGSGFGNDDADMTRVMEKYIDWEDNQNPKCTWKEDTVLIPGSSIKGAVAHRVAYHYNKLKGVFAENLTIKEIPELLEKGYTIPEKFDSNKDLSKMVIEYNPAVRALFGYTSQNEKKQQRGNVLISDVIQAKKNEKSKILNHVSIDRFTGGAIDGALFSESVVYGKEETYTFTFKVKSSVLMKDGDIEKSLENALYDIVSGLLPLGGGTNRGHGCFNGKLYKNGKEIIK
jgi:CRISPR/Cas system CSM-associated protein Csm3 (group 7 of RAMP superfamily)